MYFEERHKNHQKNGYFLCFLTNTKIIRSQRRFFVCIFAENPPLFFQTGFVRRFFCACFYCTSSYCAPALIFILPARRKTSSLLSAMSPTGNLDTTLSCLRQKKESAKFKEKFIALFCVDFCAENFLFAAIGR